MNYVFYDFETSGTDRYFDQPIQIAAQLVNEQFNVIDEITKIDFTDLTSHKYHEIEKIKKKKIINIIDRYE